MCFFFNILLQLSYLGPNQDSNKKEFTKILDERDAMRGKLMEVKQDRQALHEKLVSANRTIEANKNGSTPVSAQISELQVRAMEQ